MRICLLGAEDARLHVQAIHALNEFEMAIDRSRELLSEPTYVFVVAVDDSEEVMGRIYGHVLHRYGQTDLLLYEVDVLPEYHRKGVGHAMLDYLKQLCIDRGYSEMWVLTEHDNLPAQQLYSKAGGTLEGSPAMMYVFYPPERQ